MISPQKVIKNGAWGVQEGKTVKKIERKGASSMEEKKGGQSVNSEKEDLQK